MTGKGVISATILTAKKIENTQGIIAFLIIRFPGLTVMALRGGVIENVQVADELEGWMIVACGPFGWLE